MPRHQRAILLAAVEAALRLLARRGGRMSGKLDISSTCTHNYLLKQKHTQNNTNIIEYQYSKRFLLKHVSSIAVPLIHN